jgi:hypothetical protein
MQLPNDIVLGILQVADVSIDTYLAFKHLGLKPKKLSIPEDITEKLNTMCIRRHRYYQSYKDPIIFNCTYKLECTAYQGNRTYIVFTVEPDGECSYTLIKNFGFSWSLMYRVHDGSIYRK